ncbi:MAG: PAS domain-containing protein [Cellvibrionaceae bacterium]|nr:PAS domain-containing protein [Cellvibrionaceae bacterium]
MNPWLPDDALLFENPECLHDVLSRYRRLLKGQDYGFWEWNLRDDTFKCVGGFWEKLGFESVVNSAENIYNKEDYVHPDDYGYVDKVIMDHLRLGTPINMVYRTKTVDGAYCWTQASANSTRDENGRVTHISGVNFDLYHLKETEKALRLSEARHERVLAASNDGIWEWSAIDADQNPQKAGRIGKCHTSYSCWKHLGYSEEEVDALPETERLDVWNSHIHPHDLPKIYQAMQAYYINRDTIDIEYRMFGEQGKMFWIRSRGKGVFNVFGRMTLFSGINIDVTQIRESEERVRKAKEDAERANQSKSQFLSSMSHELRTPLNAIIGFSQLLAKGDNLSVQQQENLSCIHNAGEHLLQLINDVLDLAKIEQGKLSLSPELIRPAALINDCFNYVKPAASAKAIQLIFQPGACADSVVHVDPIRLRQCLLNLIGNAIKYNVDRGKVCVVLSHQGEKLVIAIHDTGAGIDAEKQAGLFEMFNRLGAEHSTVEGSGVGLVISKQLAEAMQGTLVYEDSPGWGACFKLSFALVDQPPVERGAGEISGVNERVAYEGFVDTGHRVAHAGAVTPVDAALHIREAKSIIYVEDNPVNSRLLQYWLQPYSQLALSVASDPFVGLFTIRSQQPDVVLLDIHLPNLDGMEIIKLLKQSPRTAHIPVIALSASAMKNTIEQALAQGFDAYLTKPLQINELYKLLNRYLA